MAAVILGGAAARAKPPAQAEPCRVIIGQFALRAGALVPVPPDAPADRRFVRVYGKGRADAQRSVVIELSVLRSPVHPVEAEVRFEPCRRFGPCHNRFRGRGRAVVSVWGREYGVPLSIRGFMRRSRDGGAVMHGRFVALTTSERRPAFRGWICGRKVSPSAD